MKYYYRSSKYTIIFVEPFPSCGNGIHVLHPESFDVVTSLVNVLNTDIIYILTPVMSTTPYLTQGFVSRVANTGAGYKAQCDAPYGRVIVELGDIGEMTLECLKVKCLVDLVELGDESGATVENEEEKVYSNRGRAFGTIHFCRERETAK